MAVLTQRRHGLCGRRYGSFDRIPTVVLRHYIPVTMNRPLLELTADRPSLAITLNRATLAVTIDNPCRKG